MDNDKIAHVIMCFVATIVGFVVLGDLIDASMITLVIGASKELFDPAFGGVMSWRDMIANIVGILFAIVTILIFQLFSKSPGTD